MTNTQLLDISFVSEDASCLLGKLLPLSDRLIFLIGGSLVMIATFFLILGFIRFKELRRQPGDLIFGIAISDFVLSAHWIVIAVWYKEVDNVSFCTASGFIGTLAGMGEYFYSVSFSLYLVTSLRNALKQDKVPISIFHIVPIAIAFAYVIFLLARGELGKTAAGTCSIKSSCHINYLNYIAPLLVASYGVVGFYTLWYVYRNAPKCAHAHAKRTQFLLYYMKYIVCSTLIFAVIAVTNLLSTISDSQLINSIYNLSKLSSPMVLSFIRYNDPLIKKAMVKTIWFKKGRSNTTTSSSSMEDTFLALNRSRSEDKGIINQEQELELDSSSRRITEEIGNSQFIFNQLAENLKVSITYTLLSCVLYADKSQRSSAKDLATVIDRRPKNPYKHERIYMVDDETIKTHLPVVQEELDRLKLTIIPGTLKAYAPEVFTQFLNNEKEFMNLQESLNFNENADEIVDASKPQDQSNKGGKSGEFFFFSKDKRIIIKTIPDVEMKMISNIIERYESHFKQYPNSLIAKIYGAFTFESTEIGQKFNLIIMKNICGFPKTYVEKVYDMKGSRYDREVLKGKLSIDKGALKRSVLKDLDFERLEKKLNIRPELKPELLRQIMADALFFRGVNLIDYSFMVFCVNKEKYKQDYGKELPSHNHLASMENTEEPGMYYNVGIGDYLQPYNFQKAFEKLLKKVRKLDMSLDTSSQDPEYYSQRFIDFIKKLI